jgi:hypothetical protein
LYDAIGPDILSTVMMNRRAIIFFVRDERREASAKPLPAPYRRAGYRSLNRRVVARLAPMAAHGIDIVVAGEGPFGAASGASYIRQRGESFGARITNAVADALALGYRDVVVVGNDCPSIATSDVAAAFDALAAGAGLAAAPTRDGGAFLIAVRGDRFQPTPFAALPWCSDALFAALCALPGAEALGILRDDFDIWEIPSGLAALAALHGRWENRRPARALPAPTLSLRRMKALSRIHLPAPPAR